MDHRVDARGAGRRGRRRPHRGRASDSAGAATSAYGQIVTGGGLAVLFLAIYAAFSFYGLIGQTTTFALLVMLTAGAAALADRQRALGLALMAVGGGFATPFLVGGGGDAQLTLFTYDALLVVGTLYLANRQGWPSLNALSFLLHDLHRRRLDDRVLQRPPSGSAPSSSSRSSASCSC